MKKTISILIAVLMLASVFSVLSINAEETEPTGAPTAFTPAEGLYAHAVCGSEDGDAWHLWQSVHDERFEVENENEKYFFLPSSVDSEKIDVYNAFDSSVTVGELEIPSKTTARMSYKAGESYTVKADKTEYKLTALRSSAEAAIFVNNSDADGNGTDLAAYLSASKSNSAKATGAIATTDGNLDNTPIKKIKGRGNTTWQKAKKPYNITYDKKVSIAGMNKGKKYSLLANYQDDSLSRNRFLYDLSDAVGMPYASDSRYVDFYINGYYAGSYQLTEKVEVGSDTLIPDFEEEDYLNEDGTVKEDFPFLCEVDASAVEGEDYFVTVSNGTKITIKAPELEQGDKGYDEVKDYVKAKFNRFYNATSSTSADLSTYADNESLALMYLVNELGKNWDSGVSSLFFTYKQDENGAFKFYASPVWDYDNSLGNAVGVESDLRSMNVSDYTFYTGWWCRYKGLQKGTKTSSNIMNRISKNKIIQETLAPKLWFERFVPALEHFAGTKLSDEINKDFYTSEYYYSLIKDSAEMNYTSGWKLNTGSWIADHSKLNVAHYDYDTKKYTVDSTQTKYASDFKGMYDYACDWFLSRAAWLSNEMSSLYKTEPVEPTSSATEPATEVSQPTEETTQPVTEATQPATQPVTEVTQPVTEATQPATEKPASAKKAENKIKAAVKTKSVSAKKLKSKAQKVTGALKITKPNGAVTVKTTSVKLGKKKVSAKKFTFTKTGKLTIKKGKYAKGTYKIKVKITAKGTTKYKKKTLNKTVSIKVK